MSDYDVVVVGGGPAGTQAAISAVTEGFRTALFEADKIGGQIATTPHLENMVGYEYGVTGPSFARQAEAQLYRLGVKVFEEKVRVILPASPNVDPLNKFQVVSEGSRVYTRSVVIATGQSFHELDIEGTQHPEVKYGPDEVFTFDAEGRTVVIVGGGNSAGQAIVHLGERADKVVVLAPTLKTSYYLTERIRNNERTEVLEGVRLVKVIRNGEDNCKVHAEGEDLTYEREGCRVFICAGMRPNTDIEQYGLWETDERGRIITGDDYSTFQGSGAPGIFAIGDVRSGAVSRVPSAIGEAANLQPHLWNFLKGGDSE